MEQQLLAAIYANPRNDDLRRVYADFLQQRGDPRGEFIALQLNGTRPDRERELLAMHATEWLEPLKKALHDESVKWSRGFPVSGTWNYYASEPDVPYVKVEALATLDHLQLWSMATFMDDDHAWELVRDLPHLRSVDGFPPDVLAFVAASQKPFALERIHCDSFSLGPDGGRAQKHALSAAMRLGTGLPFLKHLSISWGAWHDEPGDFDWLAETNAGRRLQVLCVRGPGAPTAALGGKNIDELLPAWRNWLAALPRDAALARLELHAGGRNDSYSLRMLRTDGVLSLEGDVHGEFFKPYLRKALATPGVSFDTVKLEGSYP